MVRTVWCVLLCSYGYINGTNHTELLTKLQLNMIHKIRQNVLSKYIDPTFQWSAAYANSPGDVLFNCGLHYVG